MRPNGMVFDGSTTLRSHRQLCTIAVYVTRFLVFRQRRVPVKEIMVLLLNVFGHNMCCHISGCFVAYLAEILDSFGTVCLYVATKLALLQNLLFERGGCAEYFNLEGLVSACWTTISLTTMRRTP